jgi:NTE family protein
LKSVLQRRLGLALGGGAARSLTHLGALEVLVGEGIQIACLAGTSAGSIIGAAFAAGVSLEALETESVQLTWRALARPAFSRRGLLGLGRLRELLERILPVGRFEQLRVPLQVVATDLETGERVVMGEGDLLSALMASCAIPGVFLPVEREGRLLVDGGVSCNVPADLPRAMGADVVVALDATRGVLRPGGPINMVRVISQSVYLMSRQVTERYLSHADLVVAPEIPGVSWQDLGKAPEIIEAGRREMRKALPELTRLLRERGWRRWWTPWAAS